MSPSAVSRSVSRLEDDLGIRLLQRTTRHLTLTEDGARFYDRCQQILAELEEAELEVKQSTVMPTGTLRLDLSVALGKMYITPRLPQLSNKYPDLKLNVSFSDRMVDLIEEGIDATIRVGAGKDNRFVVHPLATTQLVTCAAPAYLQRAGIPKTPQDLKNHRCVNFIYPQTRQEFEWKFQQAGQIVAMSVPSYLQFDDAEAVLEAGIQETGIIQAVRYIVAGAIARGELQPILNDYAPKLETPIAVIYPQRRYLSAKIRVFLEFMTDLVTHLKQDGLLD